jgi:hypothetical protein
MAWSSPKEWSTGYKVLASDLNTFLSNNDAALRAGGLAITSQAAGDIFSASSSTQLARLAIGTANKVLTSSGSAPQWSTQIVNAALPTNVDLGGTLDVTGAATFDNDVGIRVTATGGDLCLDAAESSTPTIRFENDQGTVDGSFDSWTSASNIQLWIGANEYLNSGSLARFNDSYDTAAVELQAGYVILRTGDDATSSARLTVEPDGAVAVAGALSKGSGSFKIDHPLPSMTDTHHLIHSFAESNETLLLYRGSVTLVAGQATVDLDDAAGMSTGTWALLCREAQCFTTNETGWKHVRGSVSGSTLIIDCEESDCTDTISWLVVANRQDAHIMETAWTDEDGRPIVEPEKA